MDGLIGIGIGQCGIRICRNFFASFATESNGFMYRGANGELLWRCLFVDGDPKGLHCLRSKRVHIDTATQTILHGNPRCVTWQHGYDSERLVTGALDALAGLLERVPVGVHGFVVFHSCEGSTGSGVGSRLLERLRDLYPRLFLVVVAIGGFDVGPPIARYNKALCLQWVDRFADCLFLFNNEEMLHALDQPAGGAHTRKPRSSSSASRSGPKKKPQPTAAADTMKRINIAICFRLFHALVGKSSLLTNHAQDQHAKTGIRTLMDKVCPMPEAKTLSVYAVMGSRTPGLDAVSSRNTSPETTFHELLKALNRQVLSWKFERDRRYGCEDFVSRDKENCLSMQVILNGQAPEDARSHIATAGRYLDRSLAVVEWNPKSEARDFVCVPDACIPETWTGQGVGVVANTLDKSWHEHYEAFRRAKLMYDARAFVHWFDEATQLEQALDSLHAVAYKCKELVL